MRDRPAKSEGTESRREPVVTPLASKRLTLWWMAAPETPHSRAISKKGMRAFLTRKERIFWSIWSMW